MLRELDAIKEAERLDKLLKIPMERSEKITKLKNVITDFLLATDWPDSIGDEMRSLLGVIEES